MKTTVDFLPPGPARRQWRGKVVLVLAMAGMFFLGLVTSYAAWPRYVTVTQPLPKNTQPATVKEKDSSPKPAERNIDAEVKHMAGERAKAMLEGCAGVVEIKDNEAQTVRYKKAAIASKGGFTDLKKGVPYTFHSYHVHNDIGYGLVGDDEGLLFHLVWYPGAIKAPTIKPVTLTVSSGKRIELAVAPK